MIPCPIQQVVGSSKANTCVRSRGREGGATFITIIFQKGAGCTLLHIRNRLDERASRLQNVLLVHASSIFLLSFEYMTACSSCRTNRQKQHGVQLTRVVVLGALLKRQSACSHAEDDLQKESAHHDHSCGNRALVFHFSKANGL
jgi:hypothetical protein